MANETFSPVKYCIVYGFGGDIQQQRVYIDPTTKRLTQELLSSDGLVYDLELHLEQDLELVNIRWNNTPVGTPDMVPDFYFHAGNQLRNASFTMVEFTV